MLYGKLTGVRSLFFTFLYVTRSCNDRRVARASHESSQ